MSHTHDMDMDMGSSTSSSASGHGMMAVFQNSMVTSLYSEAWTPNTTGTYAATCIFLIVFSAIFRGLLALRSWQENRWIDAEMKRRYVVVAGRETLAERVSNDTLAKPMVLSGNGVEENVMVVQRHGEEGRPFRLSVDPVRAVLDTVIAGVGYLLMLAVMTMNVGYFMAVLGGVFIGSLLCGRYAIDTAH
ncbi:Ctr copper transporter [Pseudoneurospora amorphoporcata]|uniref:Copper transport protein n=1 Tax=Pseudoneurospora amorphoporcata TaxID=241081 RepID=A0AAN6SIT8_9PEZI|nr:Ctr copper transporter [Pseudoneurospora amorphoporcata]